MGVSETSVPLNPMVLLIIIPIKIIKWLFVWEYTLFSDTIFAYLLPRCYSHRVGNGSIAAGGGELQQFVWVHAALLSGLLQTLCGLT